jgi:hypothetical protein
MKYALFAAAAALALSGCGHKEMPTQDTYPVKAKLALGGAPLSGGRVTLTIVDKSKYGPAECTADVRPDGTFEPSALGGQPGLYPGKWKVTVSPVGYKDGKPYTIRERIPAKYTKEESTDLVLEVASAGPTTATLTMAP